MANTQLNEESITNGQQCRHVFDEISRQCERCVDAKKILSLHFATQDQFDSLEKRTSNVEFAMDVFTACTFVYIIRTVVKWALS